ncbi:MAG: VWA domain-containing protein [Planctomycetales bacterium]|nr:VWA domain-containing protein [Planctomycetales bacterium]
MRPAKKNVITSIESLENRSMLAATADIVFVVDESGSQKIDIANDGQAIRPWVSLIARQLEEKLVSRGVGDVSGLDPNDPTDADIIDRTQNRYGVLAFGDDTVPARIVEVNNEAFASADQIDSYLATFENDGTSEDGYNAIDEAIDLVGDGGYDFRANAAVHFILISDEFRSDALNNNVGTTINGDPIFELLLSALYEDEISTFDPYNETISSLSVLNDAIITSVAAYDFVEAYDENSIGILGSDPYSVPDPPPPCSLPDREQCPVGDFPEQFPLDEAEWEIMGVDANILNGINVDANRRTAANPDADRVIPATSTDEYVVFSRRLKKSEFDYEDPDDKEYVVDANWIRESNAAVAKGLLDAVELNPPAGVPTTAYEQVRYAFDNPLENPCGNNPNCDDLYHYHPASLADSVIYQDSYHGEEYAFLTWEARGTAWDFEIIKDQFQGWDENVVDNPAASAAEIAGSRYNFAGIDDPDTPQDEYDEFAMINLFNQAFVDDTFEKIKLQIADFDSSGRIDGDDVDAILDFYHNPITPTPSSQDLVDYDYDGNGSLNDEDGLKYINDVLMLWLGDANGDGVFNSSDLVTMFEAAEYEDGVEDNSTWSEGDFNFDQDFDSSDWQSVFFATTYQDTIFGDPNDPAYNITDNDGDGFYDEADEILTMYRDEMAPIWVHAGVPIMSAGIPEATFGYYFPSFDDQT